MTPAPAPKQPLPECDDLSYTELPKFISLYIEATKWIVGLATGSFLLTGSLLATHPDSAPRTLISVGIAILSMTPAAVAGVFALTGGTELAQGTPPIPEEAIESTKEDVEWLKTQARSAKP